MAVWERQRQADRPLGHAASGSEQNNQEERVNNKIRRPNTTKTGFNFIQRLLQEKVFQHQCFAGLYHHCVLQTTVWWMLWWRERWEVLLTKITKWCLFFRTSREINDLIHPKNKNKHKKTMWFVSIELRRLAQRMVWQSPVIQTVCAGRRNHFYHNGTKGVPQGSIPGPLICSIVRILVAS